MKPLTLLSASFLMLFACDPKNPQNQEKTVKEIIEIEETPTNPAILIVEKQLEAYNAHDIDAFVATYADSVEIYSPEGQLLMKGHEQLRNGYAGFFANTPALNCKILNRMTINNTVIDKEEVIINDSTTIYGVAIYKVEEGKIQSVNFID